MALIVETGSGSSTANSLAALDFAQAYWSVRNAPTTWSGAQSAAQERWLVGATDYVERRYRWSGDKKTYLQALSWPRANASERDGQSVPDNVVPLRIQQAVAFLAALISTGWDPAPTLEAGGGIKSDSVAGVFTTVFMDNAAIEDAVAYVDGLLFPFMSAAGVADTSAAGRLRYPDRAEADFTAPVVPDEFASGAFSNTGGQPSPLSSP